MLYNSLPVVYTLYADTVCNVLMSLQKYTVLYLGWKGGLCDMYEEICCVLFRLEKEGLHDMYAEMHCALFRLERGDYVTCMKKYAVLYLG